MTGRYRVNLSPTAAAAAALSVLLIGAGGTYLLLRPDSSPMTRPGGTAGDARLEPPSPATAGAVTPANVAPPRPGVMVTLTKETIARAGIEITGVSTAGGA